MQASEFGKSVIFENIRSKRVGQAILLSIKSNTIGKSQSFHEMTATDSVYLMLCVVWTLGGGHIPEMRRS
jgi:hypothetical protein